MGSRSQNFQRPAQNFKPYDPQHPNHGYGDFVKSTLRGAAAGLGCSYNSLANDLESVNYSSLRAGSLEERDFWRFIQKWMIEGFCEPVFREFFSMGLLTQKIPFHAQETERLMKPLFTPRGWPWVDPQKDILANSLELSLGLTSREIILAESGSPDFEEVVEQQKRENAIAEAAGVSIVPIPKGKGNPNPPTGPDSNNPPKPNDQSTKGGDFGPGPSADELAGRENDGQVAKEPFDTFKVVLVDADEVNKKGTLDFTMGGNSEKFPGVVPKDELWLQKGMSKKATIGTLGHEFTEVLGIRHLGMEYEDAHDQIGNPVEAIIRTVADDLGEGKKEDPPKPPIKKGDPPEPSKEKPEDNEEQQ